MKAATYTRYGPPEVIRIEQVPTPECKDNEVLIKIRATTITAGDYRMRGFNVPALFWLPGRLYAGLFRPKRKILGTEFSGVVEAVGKSVTRFKAGDSVFGSSGANFGAHAEYICLPEDGILALKPDNISFEQAAAVSFGGLTALYFLREMGKLQEGQRLLINGASGGVGTAAIQIAASLGAQITGVCSTANVELVASLGAVDVFDYTKIDVIESHEAYDMIFDTVGTLSVARSKKILTPEGVFLTAVIQLQHVLHMLAGPFLGSKKVVGTIAVEKREDLLYLRGLLGNGRLQPYIDRSYPFEQIVEAHRYAETGHKRGNVVVKLC